MARQVTYTEFSGEREKRENWVVCLLLWLVLVTAWVVVLTIAVASKDEPPKRLDPPPVKLWDIMPPQTQINITDSVVVQPYGTHVGGDQSHNLTHMYQIPVETR